MTAESPMHPMLARITILRIIPLRGPLIGASHFRRLSSGMSLSKIDAGKIDLYD
jgi:hypothetical protein